MIGIYSIRFPDLEGWHYVGQSIHIEKRFKEHLQSLTAGKVKNLKLQEAFNYSDPPIFEVLEECSIEELSEREVYWIDKLNSIENGFNITKGGDSAGSGTTHARSKYSKEQIVQVFKKLLNIHKTSAEISEETGVSVPMVNTISRCSAHLWLKEEFPEEWEFLTSIVGKRCVKRLGKTEIVDPQGKVYIFDGNVSYFTEKMGVRTSHFYAMLNGKVKSCAGWSLASSPLKTYPPIKCPKGFIFILREGQVSKFARDNDLTAQGLHMLLKGTLKSYKGWVRCKENQS